ncbi:MAG TPA: PepSY-like domain-containing protein [Chitinophaga sp.]
MKKVIVFLCAALLSSGIGFAQRRTAKTVKSSKQTTAVVKVEAPAPVKEAFSQSFADVTDAKWTRTGGGNWAAAFDKQDIKTTAVYKPEGTWVSTHSEFQPNNIPETVLNTVKAKYPSASVKDATRIERADVASYYKVNIQDNGTDKAVLINDSGVLSE